MLRDNATENAGKQAQGRKPYRKPSKKSMPLYVTLGEATCRAGGCEWTGSTCNCEGGP